MSQELNFGDKIWMHYGPNVLIVGYLVDNSPDYKYIGVSPVPYSEYKTMTTSTKASCPINWCDVKACHYLSHIPYQDIEKHDAINQSPRLGFGK